VQPDTSGKMTGILVWNVENRVAILIDRAATGKLRNAGGIMRSERSRFDLGGCTTVESTQNPAGDRRSSAPLPPGWWPFIGSWGPGLPWGLLPVPALLLC
jgi:hypothetical protein